MALYTGKGDGGTTKAIDSKDRISKASPLPEALGTLDELNAFLGFVRMRAAGNERVARILRDTQEKLFIVQAELAGSDKRLPEGTVRGVEDIVDGIEKEIPPLKGFSVAGGTELSALLDVARTTARRAERSATADADSGLRELSSETKAYLNRLSSLLFALARSANHTSGVAEETPSYK